jgi:hypothetical protein
MVRFIVKCSAVLLAVGSHVECSHAAPAPKPKTDCERCSREVNTLEWALRSKFAACFSETGYVSAAQYYCILGVLSKDAVSDSALSDSEWEKYQTLVTECVASHEAEDPSLNQNLDLSPGRLAKCRAELDSASTELVLKRYNCQYICSPPSPAPSGQQAQDDSE